MLTSRWTVPAPKPAMRLRDEPPWTDTEPSERLEAATGFGLPFPLPCPFVATGHLTDANHPFGVSMALHPLRGMTPRLTQDGKTNKHQKHRRHEPVSPCSESQDTGGKRVKLADDDNNILVLNVDCGAFGRRDGV